MNSPAPGGDDDGVGGGSGNRKQYSQAKQMHLLSVYCGYVPNMHMYIHSYMYVPPSPPQSVLTLDYGTIQNLSLSTLCYRYMCTYAYDITDLTG